MQLIILGLIKDDEKTTYMYLWRYICKSFPENDQHTSFFPIIFRIISNRLIAIDIKIFSFALFFISFRFKYIYIK